MLSSSYGIVVDSVLVEMLIKRAYAFTMVVSSDGLGKKSAHIEHSKLRDTASFLLGDGE